jgi:hypothetical protein
MSTNWAYISSDGLLDVCRKQRCLFVVRATCIRQAVEWKDQVTTLRL